MTRMYRGSLLKRVQPLSQKPCRVIELPPKPLPDTRHRGAALLLVGIMIAGLAVAGIVWVVAGAGQ